jgi:hypothetical protein
MHKMAGRVEQILRCASALLKDSQDITLEGAAMAVLNTLVTPKKLKIAMLVLMTFAAMC